MIRLGILVLIICVVLVQCIHRGYIIFLQCSEQTKADERVIQIHLHKFLTPEETMALFQTTHGSVPEYEVVPVSHGVKKKGLNDLFSVVFLKVFGSDLLLYLEPTNSILVGNGTRVWTVVPDRSAPNGIKYELIKEAMETKAKTYHDLLNMAAVIIEEDDLGHLLMDGIIGPNLVMRPVPRQLYELFIKGSRQKRDFFSSLTSTRISGLPEDVKHTIPHIIFKNPNVKVNKGLLEPHPDLIKFLGIVENRVSRFLHPMGGVVYPEILVFMDHSLFAKFGNDVEAAKRYLLSFWNGIDLRYRLLGDPSVRMNIAGIILSTGNTGVPFLMNNIVEEKLVDADQALLDIGHYLYNDKTFIHGKDYEIFVVMANLDMCNYDDSRSFCNNKAMGYAYVASACTVNETTRMVEAIGMIEDNGGFKGIIPGAHEVGHLLGASHDDAVDGTLKCDMSDGYIMAGGFTMSENGFKWSSCSRGDTIGPDSKCLRNTPKVDNPLPHVLPGMYYNLEQQCQRLYGEGSHPCQVDNLVCVRLECYIPEADYCQAITPAAEGSVCGEDLICINGKCISKKSTNVPGNYNKTILEQFGYYI